MMSITLTFENFCQGLETARDPMKIAVTLNNATKAILRERYREDFVHVGYESSDVSYFH